VKFRNSWLFVCVIAYRWPISSSAGFRKSRGLAFEHHGFAHICCVIDSMWFRATTSKAIIAAVEDAMSKT